MSKNGTTDLESQYQEILQNHRDYTASLDAFVDALSQHQSWSSKLGLEKDFIPNIRNEPSDWGFSLKAAAVAEALVNELIKMQINNDQRGEYYSKTGGISASFKDDSGTKTILVSARSSIAHKVSLCEEHNFMFPSWIASVRAILSVRNRFAHDIRLVNRSLTDIIRKEFNEDKGSDVFDALVYPYENEVRVGEIERRGLKVDDAKRNSLSVKKPLMKVEVGPVRDILKSFYNSGYKQTEISELLRAGALLMLVQIASVVQGTKNDMGTSG